MIRALLLAVTLAASLPLQAAPNAQLVASVQSRLDRIGFSEVDASLLSTRQIVALHFRLQGRALGFGRDWIRARQDVKVILRLDPPREH